MNIEAVAADALGPELEALGVPVASGENGPRPLSGPPGPTELDQAWCTRHAFTGKVGQTLTYRSGGSDGGPGNGAASGGGAGGPTGAEVTLVGVGSTDMLAGDRGLESLRRASAAFVRSVGSAAKAAFLVPDPIDLALDDAAAALAEGAALASYRYDDFRPGIRGTSSVRCRWRAELLRIRPPGRRGAPGEAGSPSRWPWPATWSTSHRAR